MRIVATPSFICAFNAAALAEPAGLTPTKPSGIHVASISLHAVLPFAHGAVCVSTDADADALVAPDVDGDPRSQPASASAQIAKPTHVRIELQTYPVFFHDAHH